MENHSRILRTKQVLAARGRSRTQHHEDIKSGAFPKPFKLSERTVGWLAYEVDVMNRAVAAGCIPDQLKAISTKLEKARAKLKPESQLENCRCDQWFSDPAGWIVAHSESVTS